jgi:hypothetical protein
MSMNSQFRDKIHQPLAVGDTVIGHLSGSSHKGTKLMTITAFTPMRVRTDYGLYYSSDLVKINEQIALSKSQFPENWI